MRLHASACRVHVHVRRVQRSKDDQIGDVGSYPVAGVQVRSQGGRRVLAGKRVVQRGGERGAGQGVLRGGGDGKGGVSDSYETHVGDAYGCRGDSDAGGSSGRGRTKTDGDGVGAL